MEENRDENRIKTELTGKEKRMLNLKRDAGPGRPKGQRDYKTIYMEAMKILADKNATTVEKLEAEMVANGLLMARKGDFRFYKDNLDRLHGTAVQKQENNLNVVVPVLVKFLDKKDEPDNNRDTN